MEDPPGLVQVQIRNPEKGCDGFGDYIGSEFCDCPLQARTASELGSKKASFDPKLITSLYDFASPNYLTQHAGRGSPQYNAKLSLSRKRRTDDTKLSAGKGRPIRTAPSDVTAVARFDPSSLTTRDGSLVAPKRRECPGTKKRPASSDLSTPDVKPDQSRAFGRAFAIRPSVAPKYIKRPPGEHAACSKQPSEISINVVTESLSTPTSEQPHTPELLLRELRGHDPETILCLASPDSTEKPSSKAANSKSVRPTKFISQDELAAEIKGIYAALVMVEAKCIKLDSAHMNEGEKASDLACEQWQTLIALHRTLLYEHHDFLSASQHPSAGSSLTKLATKYSMPARMWKHGIHSFLEVLRRRLPDSLDYMLQFIYVAYQMVGLLYETVPSFQDTWVECLGDLARYRMAVEELDMRDREIWCGVARDWYSKTSNRNPDVGRLYHHLGILARPNAVQQLYFYGRSLTCIHPFESATESLTSLLSPLKKAEFGRSVNPYIDQADSMFLCLHAKLLLTDPPNSAVDFVTKLSTYRIHLDNQIRRQGLKWKHHGVFIAVTNISACFGYGTFNTGLEKFYRKPRQQDVSPSENDLKMDEPLELLTDTFATVLSNEKDFNVLPHVHTMLIFLWSICNLAVEPAALIGKILHAIPWQNIANLLNSFTEANAIEHRTAEGGRRGIVVPNPSHSVKPLPEDYLLRGLIWCTNYFAPEWFDGKHDDESRLLELESTNKVRIERVLRLAIALTQKGSFLVFDYSSKKFSKL